jgi:hypothetical protein
MRLRSSTDLRGRITRNGAIKKSIRASKIDGQHRRVIPALFLPAHVRNTGLTTRGLQLPGSALGQIDPYPEIRIGIKLPRRGRRKRPWKKVKPLPPKGQAARNATSVIYSAFAIALFIRGTRNSSHLPGRLGPCNVRTWDMRTMAGSGRGKLSPLRPRNLERCPSPPN